MIQLKVNLIYLKIYKLFIVYQVKKTCEGKMGKSFTLLDSQHFEAFLAAAEELNFTKAAEKVYMTQSGVTQHVQKLEQQLDLSLFKRIKKKMYLTSAGKELKNFIEKYLDDTARFLEKANDEFHALKGWIRYAMPSSCLMSSHFPAILEEVEKKYPNIKLCIKLCTSNEVYEKLLNNEIDFGFITERIVDLAIISTSFCFEEYVWITADKEIATSLSPEMINNQKLIYYPGVEVLYKKWHSTHFPNMKTPNWHSLNTAAGINSLQGAIPMVEHGLGITIISKHCVQKQLTEKKLFTLTNKDFKTVQNEISIITLKDFYIPQRAEVIINKFLQLVKK